MGLGRVGLKAGPFRAEPAVLSLPTHRSRRLLTGAALSALLFSVVLPATPAGSATTESVTAAALAASPAEDEGTFLTLLNQERRHAGLAPMVLDIRLAQTARDWSSVMAAQDRLSHDSNLAAVATSVESRWSSGIGRAHV